MPAGRPPNIEPATAYDYRHYIELVQAIATGKRTVLHELMRLWEVPVDRMWCDMDGYPTFDGMTIMLTRYVTGYVPDYVKQEPRP